MKTIVLTLVLMILFSSSFAQSGLMIQLNMHFNNDGISWNKEAIIFKNHISIGLTIDITDFKIGYSLAYLPFKIQNEKISPQIKIKNFFTDLNYNVFSISAIIKKDNFGAELGYDLSYKYKDNFKIGLAYIQNYKGLKNEL